MDCIQVEQMSPNDDISNFLSRSARPCCCSVISVSSSLPLGTRSTHTQRAPWELFNGCTVLENQTRQRWSDHRRILLSKRDRTLERVRICGIYWRTMRHRRNGASFRDLSNIQIQSTKSVQVQSTKSVQNKYNLPSLYKYNLPSTSVQVQMQYQVCLKAKCLYEMCIVA